MKKKIIIIISILLLLLTGLIIGVVLFIKDFNEDRERTLKIMEEIKAKYNEFSPIVEKFSTERTNFYTAKEELFFLESVQANKETINNMLVNYKQIVIDMHENSTYLQENCNRKYSSSSVNNTCDLFKQGYESVVNYYLTDTDMYNKFVDEYNNWLTTNGMTLEPMTKEELSLYNSYIDYDNDGSYLGGK